MTGVIPLTMTKTNTMIWIEVRDSVDSPGDAFRDDSKDDGDDKHGLSIRLGKDCFLTNKMAKYQ